MNVKFEFQITQAEYTNGMMLLSFGKWQFKGVIIFGALAILSFVVGLMVNPEPSSYSIFMFGVCFLGLFPLLIWNSARSQFKKDKKLSAPRKYRISGNKLHLSSGKHQSDIKLTDIHRLREAKKLYLIYEDKNNAHFIPKRALAKADWLALKEKVEQ